MADVKFEDMPFLDDPKKEIWFLIGQNQSDAEQFAAEAKTHYWQKEWAESRTASLLSAAYSAIALNLIASTSGD